MGRQCSFPGCRNTSGLHSFPADTHIRQQWFRALGLPDRDLPPRAGVCNSHFSRDCFSNLMEVDMGFTKVPTLKSNAVPNAALPSVPRGRASQQQLHLLPTTPLLVKIQPKPTREIGCQTEPVSTKHAAGQADIKPYRRSKATQAPTSNRSMSCVTGNFIAVPETLVNPEVPGESSIPVKRIKREVSSADSSNQRDISNSAMNCTSFQPVADLHASSSPDCSSSTAEPTTSTCHVAAKTKQILHCGQCRQPYPPKDPEGLLLWVQCDGCHKLFHTICVSSEMDLDNDEFWCFWCLDV